MKRKCLEVMDVTLYLRPRLEKRGKFLEDDGKVKLKRGKCGRKVLVESDV